MSVKVAIYGQQFKAEHRHYVETLLEAFKKHPVDFVVEKGYSEGIKDAIPAISLATFTCFEDLDDSFDFMFTIGGDGTILRAVTLIRDNNIPIVGINAGRLGFLATVQKEEIAEAVDRVMAGKYKLKKRSLLCVATKPETAGLSPLNFALNEVSVNRKNTTSMITIETFLDNEFLTAYWADGLIIATPTGSTGYSLSCGGPIITPAAKSFALTPIAPHNLNARPLVIPDDTEITFTVSGREGGGIDRASWD